MDSQITLSRTHRDGLHLLEAAFQSSSDICLLFSADLKILAMNPVAERLYQWKASEVLNRNFQDLCETHGYNFLLDLDSIAAAKQQKTVFLSSFGIGTHETKKIQWKLSSALHNDQLVILWIGTFIHESGVTAVDINNIWASMPGNVFWKDREGVYLGATSKMAMTFGLKTAGDVIGKTDYDLFSKSQADILHLNDQEIMDSGVPKIIEEKVTLNGIQQIFSSEKIPLKNNNEVIGLVGNSVDITHLKKLESELRKAREFAETKQKIATSYLESIVECMPGSLYWKNKEGLYLGCNNFLVEMLNLGSRDDIVGKTDRDLWPEQAESLRRNDEEVMQSGQSIRLEETLILPNGEQRYYTVVKIPLKDPQGNIVGIIGNSLDITDLKRITAELKHAKEQAEIANKAKSEFLAVVSHELRIPLTNILGMTYYLGTEPLSSQQKTYLDNTTTAANHLLALVNDLLDFAKIEVGKFELALAPLDLRVLVEDTLFMFTQQAKAKNIELFVHYAQTVPHKIFGDVRALRQIIINLIGNAVKFTEKGHVSIQIDCLKQLSKEACLEFVVADTGIGISAEKLDLIFERFQQVDSSLIRKYQGTGLGLTITKALLEMMGGVIEVKSVLGEGSTFKCTINFPLEDDAIIEQPWSAYQSSVRILIIDDTPRGDVLRQQISPTNCQVISSKEALNTFIAFQQSSDPYQVVIINSPLQASDPFSLAKMINNTHGLLKPMLILLTEKGTFNQKTLAKKAGFFDCLVKPIQPIELQSNLTAAWEKWVEHRAILLKQNNMPRIESNPNALRVLLVEDVPMILILHQRFLTDLGCIVETAEDGRQTLEKLKNGYDIVFMDMGLPDISGDEVIKQYRASEEELGTRLPIIALTAYGAPEYQQKFLESGIDKVMVKPVTKEQLSQVLQLYHKLPPSLTA